MKNKTNPTYCYARMMGIFLYWLRDQGRETLLSLGIPPSTVPKIQRLRNVSVSMESDVPLFKLDAPAFEEFFKKLIDANAGQELIDRSLRLGIRHGTLQFYTGISRGAYNRRLDYLKLPRPTSGRIPHLTPEQKQQVLAACRKCSKPHHHGLRLLCDVALMTGLRLERICATFSSQRDVAKVIRIQASL